MDRKEIIDDFGTPEIPEKIPLKFKPVNITTSIYHDRNSRNIGLKDDFIQTYCGEPPERLYLYIVEETGRKIVYIDEYRPPDSIGMLFLSRNPGNPENTYSIERKVTTELHPNGKIKYRKLNIPVQIMKLMPEIKTANKVVLSRKPTPEYHENYVRWRAIFLP